MRKLITVLLLLVSSSSFAHEHDDYRHEYRGGLSVPAIIGAAALGYAITRPMYQQPYYNTYQQPQPVYQYQWVYDPYCNCQRQIQVRVQ